MFKKVSVPKDFELIEMAEVEIVGSDDHDLDAVFIREV